MKYVSDLMTTHLITVSADHSMKNLHDLISKRNIRHIPIMSPDDNSMIGLVTQKVMISKVISLLTEVGAENLVEQEMKIPVMDIAIKDFDTIQENEVLSSAAEYFLKNKHGCLPVENKHGELVGMLTSSDFVKLSINLLSNEKFKIL